MEVYDISTRLTPELVTWPGEKGLTRTVFATVETNGVELSRLDMGGHTGTHIDAPRHFVAGAGGIDGIDPAKCVGPARVVDLTDRTRDITAEDIQELGLTAGGRVLIKTQNSVRRLLDKPDFHDDYIALTPEAAHALVQAGVVFVGVDYLSVERKGSPGHPVHVALLEKGIVILEGADLSRVPAGDYTLAALPLSIPNGDGSPTRAVLTSDV
ncbi:MAG: cyclase family protein [Candidatus Kerfeldbacteria bacterium]|nr:cyclase family protein [Candidatus Kerfeldbacteria bacterium]